jgi:hypothetical protein
MAITQINRQVLKALEPAVLAKLNETLGKEFGLHFKFSGGGNFTASNAVLKLEIAVKDASGNIIDRSAEDFTKYATAYGLQPEWLNTAFRSFDGTEYRITGLNPNRPKNCVMATNTRTGKKYVMPPSSVISAKSLENRIANKPAPVAMNGAFVRRVNQQVSDLRHDNPEMFYADGEFKAQGMTEKQIEMRWFDQFVKEAQGPTLKEQA